MFPFVFLTLPLSSPFTLQIVAFFEQQQPAASSHKRTQGSWGKRVVETNSFAVGLLPPLRLQVFHPPAPGKLSPSILQGKRGSHPTPGEEKRHGAIPGAAQGTTGLGDAARVLLRHRAARNHRQALGLVPAPRSAAQPPQRPDGSRREQSRHQHESNFIPGKHDGSNKDLRQH